MPGRLALQTSLPSFGLQDQRVGIGFKRGHRAREGSLARYDLMQLEQKEHAAAMQRQQRAEQSHDDQSGDRVDYLGMLEEFGLSDWMLQQVLKSSAVEVIAFPHPVAVAARPSAIHGQGVFATDAISAGQLIAPARIAGELTPAGRYTNHAKRANAEYVLNDNGDIDIVALREIAVSEEITNDYRINARVSYASVTGVPVERVTREMVRDAVLAACRDAKSGGRR